MKSLAIIITTYNNEDHIEPLLKSCIDQDYDNMSIIIADDGSEDETVNKIRSYQLKDQRISLLALEHGERGRARHIAIEEAKRRHVDFMCFLDSDMILEKNLVNQVTNEMTSNPTLGAMVLKEIPYSTSNNFVTKIKLFERRVVNNSSLELDPHSIEAARFWRMSAYIGSGEIDQRQIAFEETQPTIRYRERGGLILKHGGAGVMHDEKHVTLSNLFGKKKYHFKMMNKTFDTEDKGLLKAIKRWYFFRPILYKRENILLYIKHPTLFVGMILMYLVLTAIGVVEMIKGRMRKLREESVAYK